MSSTELQERVEELERALSVLIYGMNFRSRLERDKARRYAQEVLEGVKNG